MRRACIECAACHEPLGAVIIDTASGERVAGVTAAGMLTFTTDGGSSTATLLCDACDAETYGESAPSETQDTDPTPE